MRYTDSLAGITPAMLEGFFDGWPKAPSAETHLRLMQGSARVMLAIDDEAGRVAGFVNAVSDGVLAAYIPLLEVLPAYRGRGIGRELMRRLLASLDGLYMIDLTCDPDRQSFYSALGMRPMISMVIRNFDRQSGIVP